MFSPDFRAGDARYQKEALHLKWDLIAGLGHAEQAPEIMKVRQAVQLDPSDAAVHNPGFCGRDLRYIENTVIVVDGKTYGK